MDLMKRVRFRPGAQKRFIDKVLLQTSVVELASICTCSPRTIRDWRRGKFLMSAEALYKISQELNVRIPGHLTFVPNHWQVNNAAKRGGQMVIEKYGHAGGDIEIRKRKWLSWWRKKGWASEAMYATRAKRITQPPHSVSLAEFCGIMLGDGGISKHQVTITLHIKDDRLYAAFVTKLIRDLFHLEPSLIKRAEENVGIILISRTALVEFLVTYCGLVQGNKIAQEIDIPKWIKTKKKYRLACLRGLIDTDGCIYNHSYIVKGKKYVYKKISFTSASAPLRKSVSAILEEIGLGPKIRGAKDVRLENSEDVNRYFRIVSSHNPKHLKRFKK